MNLYLIEQNSSYGEWEYFDLAVVKAETAEQAKNIHPKGGINNTPEMNEQHDNKSCNDWARNEKVTATLIGKSISDKPGVVCASFNAG